MSPLRRAATASLVLGTLAVVAGPARAGLIGPPMGVTVDDVQTVPIGDPTFIHTFTLKLQPGWALVTRNAANFFDPANDGIDIDIDYLGASLSQPLGFAGLASGLTLRYFFYGEPIYGSIIAPFGGSPVDLSVEVAGLTGTSPQPFKAVTLSTAPAEQLVFHFHWRATPLKADGTPGDVQDHGDNTFVVPEPASLAMLAAGLVGIGVARRRRSA